MDEPATSPVDADDEKTRTRPVERDSAFRHYAVDSGLIFNLGHDVELAFLRDGPSILAQRKTQNEDQSEEPHVAYKLKRVLNEVVRIRMPPAECSVFALTILAELVEDEDIDLDALKSNLDRILKIAEEAAKKNDPEDAADS